MRLSGARKGVRCSRGLGHEPFVMIRPVRVLIIAILQAGKRSKRSLEFDDQHVRIGGTDVLANM